MKGGVMILIITISDSTIWQGRNFFLTNQVFSYPLWPERQRIYCDRKWRTILGLWLSGHVCDWRGMAVWSREQGWQADDHHISIFLSLFPLSCRGWTLLRLSTKPLFHSLVNACSFSADCFRDRCTVCWSFPQVHFFQGHLCVILSSSASWKHHD